MKTKEELMSMSADEFDKYMCQTYPEMFINRNLPMSQTCMCWGFCIGKGWYSVLDSLCSEIKLIQKTTGIIVIFDQIKEKYGGARFYCHVDTEKSILSKEETSTWDKIIDTLVSYAESKCDYICASCGKDRYEIISIGGWTYDECSECLKKDKGGRTT